MSPKRFSVPTLRQVLDERTREADPSLYEKLDDNRVRCFSCGHCCPIPEGQPGVCKVRFNRGGKLYVPWGYTAGMQCDPIEKKPFFHAHPGALAYSFGMLGCDLHCGYCQNWVTSQALRDPNAVSFVHHGESTQQSAVSIQPVRRSASTLRNKPDAQRQFFAPVPGVATELDCGPFRCTTSAPGGCSRANCSSVKGLFISSFNTFSLMSYSSCGR